MSCWTPFLVNWPAIRFTRHKALNQPLADAEEQAKFEQDNWFT